MYLEVNDLCKSYGEGGSYRYAHSVYYGLDAYFTKLYCCLLHSRYPSIAYSLF